MDEQPTKPTRTRAPRARRPAARGAAAGAPAYGASALAASAEAEAASASVDAASTAEAPVPAPEAAAPAASPPLELHAIEDEDDVSEPGAPATRKAGKADLRALGEALAADPALRLAVFGADDPIEASDAWLRAARGVRLRKRQRAAMTKVWGRAGALLVTAASGELGHWLHHR